MDISRSTVTPLLDSSLRAGANKEIK